VGGTRTVLMDDTEAVRAALGRGPWRDAIETPGGFADFQRADGSWFQLHPDRLAALAAAGVIERGSDHATTRMTFKTWRLTTAAPS